MFFSYHNTQLIQPHLPQVKSNITSIPLSDSTANIIISNCVINLVPDAQKPLVFTEIFRLLAPGGRVSISDILAKKALPKEIREDTGLYIGCVSGASELGEYEKWMKEAGFSGKWTEYIVYGGLRGILMLVHVDIVVVNTDKDLNVYKDGILQVETDGSELATSNQSGGSG